jgi:hypothetical protein
MHVCDFVDIAFRCTLYLTALTYAAALFTVLLQQNYDVGEAEDDVLKQVDAMETSARISCTKCTERAAAATAAASKGDTMPNNADGVADRTEPVA